MLHELAQSFLHVKLLPIRGGCAVTHQLGLQCELQHPMDQRQHITGSASIAHLVA